ncbi:copper amine oxidase [Paenibacillus albidus]|uniref:stalk domain-containing protein n=1 Tax=Paenibacillus albidus TaxID=2041023 RepID=UPI001BE802FB|nr:stalk domain-containing protein [Paenibacillus albidus]MBT2293230.1 copper amine oxidase [Paenibacillus albidus]
MLNVWKKALTAGTSSLLLLAVLITSGGRTAEAAEAAAAAQIPQSDVFRIVTLGDSITAGYEPGMTDPNIKPYGYAERLLEQAWYHGRSDLSNYGILGLTTEGLRNYTEAIKDGAATLPDRIQIGISDPRIGQFAAQAPGVRTELAEADLVTITIGGNDVSSLLFQARDLAEADFNARVEQVLAAYSVNVKAALENIRMVNPQATIMLADQYQPASKLAAGPAYTKLMSAAARFTANTEQVAASTTRDGAPVVVAHVASQFAGVEGPLTHIMRLEAPDFHPTQLGYEKIAGVFAGLQWGEYRMPDATALADTSAPMSIVVKGVELNTPNKPILKNGQNFLALRDILNAVGAEGKWDNKTSSATITYGGKTVVITIGSKVVQVNGQDVAIETPAFLQKVGKEDKTYLPLASLATGLGFDVNYSSHLRTAFINP